MEPSMITLRRATLADADDLARFGAQSFRDAYAHTTDPSDLALHIEQTYTSERQHAEFGSPDVRLMLALDQNEIAGYSYVRLASPHALVDPSGAAELKRFYVGSAWHGCGVAQSLMQATLEASRAEGARAVWLTVWSENARALRFYARMGFVDIGETTFLLGTDLQNDRVLSFRC
jgi:ribosomal protein S18 acetylase RimI-like enzyme